MYTGTEAEMKSFEVFFGFSSVISEFVCGMLELMGCKMTGQQDGSIKLWQEHMLRELHENYLRNNSSSKGDRGTNYKQATA